MKKYFKQYADISTITMETGDHSKKRGESEKPDEQGKF